MKAKLTAFLSGLLFAAGLCCSGMTRPEKVIGFLRVSRAWDPSLAFVMLAAVAVAAFGFRVAARRRAPVFEAHSELPRVDRPIDRRLLLGAALFGIGWGLTGLCPGPAVVSLASGQDGLWVFVAAMLGGMVIQRALQRGIDRVRAHARSGHRGAAATHRRREGRVSDAGRRLRAPLPQRCLRPPREGRLRDRRDPPGRSEGVGSEDRPRIARGPKSAARDRREPRS
jgi:uncharacterized protein